jgi:hypothetical protein
MKAMISEIMRRILLVFSILGMLITSVFSQNVIRGAWTTQADSYRGQNGKQFTITFPAGGVFSPRLWGTDLYTDDSSIGTAAVHAGLITLQNGGTVTFEIRPGASSYQGSTRNGVSSSGYGAFSGSFIFANQGSVVVTPVQPANAIQGTWTTQADNYRGQNGKQVTINFPAGGVLSPRLWGTDLYTDDSSIGTAAVHAGLINPQSGGTVTIEIRPGASSYQGSTRNGITSSGYGGFSGSFIFVGQGSAVVIPVQPANIIQGTWATQADSYRGQNGKQVTISFPAGGVLSSRLWGTDLYTDDSSIGTAAVHAGLINPQSGGTVTIEIRPGVSSYQGSTRNGITSSGYGAFQGSFVFVNQGSAVVTPVQPVNAIQGTWTAQADSYRGQNGKRYTITFPPGGVLSPRLWGTDLYTDDSSIGTAAVHAGLINPQSGGTVTIEIRPGASSYQGSTRNGITSSGYGGFSGSFVFAGQGSAVVTPVQPANSIQGTWTTQADNYRGQNGKRYTITFPSGGVLSPRLWGTDLYTDDSSIGTAAVHAGLINPQSGGTVTIEIRPGASSYQGSTRNSVTSSGYGAFSGSFVFINQGTAIYTPVNPANTILGTWTTQADSYRGQNGKQYTITFQAGGVLSARLWGTDLYTDDSSIGTAAVHAGLINPQNGGTVTIEIRPGASSYQGSTRNGITSSGYGAYSGSFIFIKN